MSLSGYRHHYVAQRKISQVSDRSQCKTETSGTSLSARPLHILIVEDDLEILSLLKHFLSQKGYIIYAAEDLSGLQAVLHEQAVDMVLLDLMLPKEDGKFLCRYIKKNTALPLLIISALSEVDDRIVGLNLGADDYIAKPFDPRELEARICAVFRRNQNAGAPQEYCFGNWRFLPRKSILYSQKGVRVTLTGAETKLLQEFCQNPDKAMARSTLVAALKGDADEIDPRAIDLIISRLRRKLAEEGGQLELIRTVRGEGYVFQPHLQKPKGGFPAR